MAKQSVCDRFNDVFEQIPPNATKVEKKAIEDRNRTNARIYHAVKDVLERDFSIKTMPPSPEQFPGGLKDSKEDLAKVTAILGLIHADNWQDPANGKTVPNTDDIVGTDGSIIDRRFIDAVVDAVKEYTTASKLFNNVFELMIAEAAEGVSPAPSQTSSK